MLKLNDDKTEFKSKHNSNAFAEQNVQVASTKLKNKESWINI